MKKVRIHLIVLLLLVLSGSSVFAQEELEEGPDVSRFGSNEWLRSMENDPFVDIPGEVGAMAFGGTALLAGIPFVMIGQIFYFPFSGQKYFYPGMKQMYFSYYDFVMNEFRYTGYYLLATPFYAVKLCVWDAPVYLLEAAFGSKKDPDQPYTTIK